MMEKELRELLERDPFEPFCVRASSGDKYDVRAPGLTVLMRKQLLIYFPKSDRWTLVPFLHIAAIEKLGNGHPPKRRRGKAGGSR